MFTTPSPSGVPCYYENRGAGQTLLLLHGFTGSSVDWPAIPESLSAGFQIILPDLRGHGRSANPSKHFRHDEAAGDILGLLDYLGISSVKGIGISAGGNVLLHLATKQPDRVTAQVLVSATTHFPEQARAIMRQFTFESLPAQEQEKLRLRHPGGDPQIQRLIADAQAFADSYDDLNFTPADLQKITARTLLVQGDQDPFYPIEITRDMARAIPNAELWEVTGGGHVPVAGERWDEFLPRAFEFLR